MLRVYASGHSELIQNDDWKLTVKGMRKTLIAELVHQGMPIGMVAEMFGIHRQTARTLARRDPNVTPVFGSGEWTPKCQDQKPKSCDRCGGDKGIIKRGSSLYCAACHKTGMEKRLVSQRVAADIQEAYEAIESECEAIKSRKTLAQRRKNRRA